MRLSFATEYPMGTLPGEAMAALTTLVQDAIGTELEIDALFDTAQPVLGACAASNVQFDGGAVFGASLIGHARVFELAAIPCEAGWHDAEDDARRFRGLFKDGLYRAGFRLIASVPMPPTGLWTSRAIDCEEELACCRIRTYDALSSEVFSALGCTAVRMPFSQLSAALDSGEIDAVLSSGDGSAGTSLSRYCRNYLPLGYSTPLCFLVVRESSFIAMPKRWQRALKWAGREIQARYFNRQATREQNNLRAMRERGIQVGRGLPHHAAVRLERKMELVRQRLITEHMLADVLVPIA
ncbi:hypothetical protein ACI2VH_09955 [Ralstonia nicotianae]|uniref:Uncharacterized protein n=1 Tax=Ralstonia nicotianae TaxID=3037696 RepID=A0ABX8A0R5_9RALS|nr:hypothetical protein [Ralstonia nicotianae]QUP61126.1 hypothetical protein GO999_21715 [Ralstonia nicotianae]